MGKMGTDEVAKRDAEAKAKIDELNDAERFEEEQGRPPTPDELAERRAARATAEADRELEEAEGGHRNGSGSIEGGELAPGTGEEDDGQIFVWEQGRKVTLGTLIARGTPVENVFVFSGKRVKGRGGLMALDEKALMVVRTLSGGTKIVPTHDDQEKVESVVVENIVQTKVINPAESEDAIAMLRPVFEKMGYDIVERQVQATG